MKIITIVEVVIMEAVGMLTNLHTGDIIETPNPDTTVDTDKDTRLNMVENNIPHTVEVMETTTSHPNTAVGTDKDTRFNMVEVMGLDTELSLNLTEEVTKLYLWRISDLKLRRLPTRRLWKCVSDDGNRIRKSPGKSSCLFERLQN